MPVLKAMEAARKPAPRVVPADTQQVCIDLPGEAIQCVVHKPKLELVLRKHRDVIFDIQLFKGMQYTVEAHDSEIYNLRDKKIVPRKKAVSFKDGEQLHLWIGREFKGNLTLKANGKLLGQYAIPALDPCKYDAEPTTKPAPFVVALKNQPNTQSPWLPLLPNKMEGANQLSQSAPLLGPLELSSSQPHASASMHVVEINPSLGTMPDEIANFFKNGGESTAIDPETKLMTRNWLWAQITAGAAYISDAALSKEPWLKDLWRQRFHLQKVAHKSGPKWYVIFKGQPGLRNYMKGVRYLTDNTKVVAITAGVGSIKGVHKASWEAAKGTFKGAAKFALILTVALDTAEWLADYEDRDPKTNKPKRDICDLIAKICTDVVWGTLGAVIGVAIMSLAVPGLVAAGLAFGGVVAIGSVLVAIGVGLGLAYMDSKLGITSGIAEVIRNVADKLEKSRPNDYADYGESLNAMMLGGAP